LKALNPVEWNYEIHNTEMLTIIIIRPITRTSNIFESLRSSIDAKLDGCCTCRDLTSRFTISQVEVWVGQMHSLGKLITVQVKVIMTTSLSYPPNYFASNSQAWD
jgi:hypothetical protein